MSFIALSMHGMDSGQSSGNSPRSLTRQEIAEAKIAENKRKEKAKIERYKKQGLKPFRYSGFEVWALNEKSAYKKAKKQGLLKIG